MGEKNWPPGGVGPFITDTPKPKAEETLKACPCVDDWSGEYNSMADAIKNCPNRRTTAKDVEEVRCKNEDNPCESPCTESRGDCEDYLPTAPADEGEGEALKAFGSFRANCRNILDSAGIKTNPGSADEEILRGIASLRTALNDAHTDSRQQKDRVERLVTENKKLKVALSDEGESIHEKLWAEQRKNDDARKWPCVYCGKKDALIKLLKGKVAELELEVDCLGEEAAQVTCERNGYEFHMEKAEAALAEKEAELVSLRNDKCIELGCTVDKKNDLLRKRIEELEGIAQNLLGALEDEGCDVEYAKAALSAHDNQQKQEPKERVENLEAMLVAAREYETIAECRGGKIDRLKAKLKSAEEELAKVKGKDGLNVNS